MRKLELDTVFVINGRLAIKLTTFAKLLNYSDVYLLQLIKKLQKQKIKIGFKYKRNWYIYLPKKPTTLIIQEKNKNIAVESDIAITPSAKEINVNWAAAIELLPAGVRETLEKQTFSISTVNNQLVIPTSSVELLSSTLGPKNETSFIAPNLGSFPATTEYKYGYYITYNPLLMSIFNPGTSTLLNSIQLPAAFFEVCRALDAAENNRNGANPGLPPQRNISTTVSFDTGTIAVAATIPISVSIGAGGVVTMTASNYLGSIYGAFDVGAGNGDLTSDTLPETLLEMATLLANAEKAVTPAENQPNNIQISFDLETSTATIAANMPFTSSAAADGAVEIIAIDYL